MSPTRRAVLGAVPVLALGACTDAPAPAPPDPDVALRAAAVERERVLLAAYDAALVTAPAQRRAALTAVRAEHQAHLERLAPPAASPGATPTPTPVAVVVPGTDLPALERAAAGAHAAAVPQASRPLAALLAQLAASEASHPQALA